MFASPQLWSNWHIAVHSSSPPVVKWQGVPAVVVSLDLFSSFVRLPFLFPCCLFVHTCLSLPEAPWELPNFGQQLLIELTQCGQALL